MHLLRSVKPISIIAVIILTLTVLLAFLSLGGVDDFFKPHNKNVTRVTLRNFRPGTKVDYRISSSTKVIAEKQKQVDKDGILSLPVDKDMLPEASLGREAIKYELSIAKPTNVDKEKQNSQTLGSNEEPAPAELLNLMLSLNPGDDKMNLSVKGLEEYANVLLEHNNNDAKRLHADWAGIFSTTLDSTKDRSKIGPDSYNQLKLAFQGSGIQSDLLSDTSGIPLIEAQAITGALLGTGGKDKQTKHWSEPFAILTEELSAVMAQQTFLVGTLIDASIQLQTQLKIQELQTRAHKDYHPSEQMCRIGSYIRSVALAESKTELEKTALNKYLMNQYMGLIHSSAAGGPNVYEPMKIKNYVEDYCHTADNGSATEAICKAVANGTPAATLERMNKDIDYTRTVETRLTLDINFTDGVSHPDEEDIFTMARYLYFPSTYNAPKLGALTKDLRSHYESRSYAAKMGVAHNSFINIIGMKSMAPVGQPTTATAGTPSVAPFATGVPVEDNDVKSIVPGIGIAAKGECDHKSNGGRGGVCLQTEKLTTRPTPTILAEDSGWAYMKAMLREFGLAVNDIDKILGARPSYYAQMDFLTKKIYQNPNFYINLYDKPANVKRIGAALDTILLMHQRDRFESLLRQEMLSAVLVENALYDTVEEINAGMLDEIKRAQRKKK